MFILPSNKNIKNELGIAYQKCVLELKELLSITYETASITTDLWIAHSNDGYIGVAKPVLKYCDAAWRSIKWTASHNTGSDWHDWQFHWVLTNRRWWETMLSNRKH